MRSCVRLCVCVRFGCVFAVVVGVTVVGVIVVVVDFALLARVPQPCVCVWVLVWRVPLCACVCVFVRFIVVLSVFPFRFSFFPRGVASPFRSPDHRWCLFFSFSMLYLVRNGSVIQSCRNRVKIIKLSAEKKNKKLNQTTQQIVSNGLA